MIRSTPRHAAEEIERRPRLPAGDDERLTGYGVLGLPFALGDTLAFRRYTASSIGPAFTAVWHRDPHGRWTVYSDITASRATPRHYGAALSRVVETEIRLDWTGDQRLSLSVPGRGLQWALRLEASVATRVLGFLALGLPRRSPAGDTATTAAGRLAGRLLRSGRLRLQGETPNGQRFYLRPRSLWLATASAAVVEGRELGPLGSHGQCPRLGDLVLPDRGLFFLGDERYEPLDPDRHRADHSSRVRARRGPDPETGRRAG